MLILLMACNGRKQSIPAADIVVTEHERAADDSLLNEIFLSLNDITENLNTIKIRENLIASGYSRAEVPMEPTAGIKADIAAIDELLAENRRTIERLHINAEQLRKSNYQVASLEKLLSSLADQIAVKDSEIDDLKEELRIKAEQVETLAGTVEQLSTELDAVAREKGELTDSLHTAYYIVGTVRDLQKKGIINKSGFIGRTLVVSEQRELDDFVRIDTRTFDEVIIGQKNVELVTTHPEGSYVFVMGDRNVYQSLVITDKQRFWGRSKVLVLCYK